MRVRPCATQHVVLYDDGVEESVSLPAESYVLYGSPEEEAAVCEFSMRGPCFFCDLLHAWPHTVQKPLHVLWSRLARSAAERGSSARPVACNAQLSTCNF